MTLDRAQCGSLIRHTKRLCQRLTHAAIFWAANREFYDRIRQSKAFHTVMPRNKVR
nr:MAG TPA: Splicing factor SF3a60 binding domain [Bacteriophage sp.]